jgi:AmiR/NasT family two-component response regulator
VAVPIIAVTSYAMANDFETIKKAECNGCLEEPIDPSAIMDQIMVIIKATK